MKGKGCDKIKYSCFYEKFNIDKLIILIVSNDRDERLEKKN
jgi:hypothetical protein